MPRPITGSLSASKQTFISQVGAAAKIEQASHIVYHDAHHITSHHMYPHIMILTPRLPLPCRVLFIRSWTRASGGDIRRYRVPYTELLVPQGTYQ